MRPPILIGLITFRRPRMLSALLDSLDATQAPDFDLACVVVDNDSDASARPAVEAWTARSAFPVSYIIEDRRGIPFARNRVLTFAQTNGFPLVAMADDDVRVRPDWIIQLHTALRAENAQAACGGMRFEAEAETDAIGRELLRQRNGKRVRAFHSTCCCLVDSDALAARGLSFDPRFAATGGEDSDLFDRLRQDGGRIALVNEPLAVETVPASRLTLGWHFSRAARVSALQARRAGDERGRLAAASRFLPQAVGGAAVGAGQLLISPAAGLKFLVRATKKAGAAYGWAMGCFGAIPQEYKKTHGG